jgi:type II secretory pathway component GspD/PulD (secretin)
MKLAFALAAATLATPLFAAQPTSPKSAPEAPVTKAVTDSSSPRSSAQRCDAVAEAPLHTYYLANAAQQQDANEVVTAIRNVASPCDKVLLVSNQEAILVRAAAEDIPVIEKTIADLDRPHKMYRLTYTLTELDGDKRISQQHFSMLMVEGQENRLKEGIKVPISTSSLSAGEGKQTAVTYLDVGTNIDATLVSLAAQGRLKYSLEESSVAPEVSGVGPEDPILRQSSLQGEATLAAGKPSVLGTIDFPSSTHHIDIEVVMQPLP